MASSHLAGGPQGPLQTPPHLLERIKKVQVRLRQRRLSALLVTSACDIRYLTGFIGDDSWVLLRARSPLVHVLSDFRFQQQITQEAPHVKAIMRKRSLAQELAKLSGRCKLQRIGLQAGEISLAQRKALAKHVGSRRLVAFDDGMLTQRAIKDTREIAAIEKAIRVTRKAFLRTREFVQPGMSEFEVAAYLEYQMRRLGAEGASFPTIVAADVRSSLPHAIPGQTKIKTNGIVLIDWGAKVNGYCGDLTRVLFFGKVKPILRRIYRIVLDAHDAAVDAIAPGKLLKQVDAVARDLITDAGYGKQFGHSLGHGIGLLVHEMPTLASASTGVLQPGHIVTVEPGIYLPGVGGIRIESDVLVTGRGWRILSDLPRDPESTII